MISFSYKELNTESYYLSHFFIIARDSKCTKEKKKKRKKKFLFFRTKALKDILNIKCLYEGSKELEYYQSKSKYYYLKKIQKRNWFVSLNFVTPQSSIN